MGAYTYSTPLMVRAFIIFDVCKNNCVENIKCNWYLDKIVLLLLPTIIHFYPEFFTLLCLISVIIAIKNYANYFYFVENVHGKCEIAMTVIICK